MAKLSKEATNIRKITDEAKQVDRSQSAPPTRHKKIVLLLLENGAERRILMKIQPMNQLKN